MDRIKVHTQMKRLFLPALDHALLFSVCIVRSILMCWKEVGKGNIGGSMFLDWCAVRRVTLLSFFIGARADCLQMIWLHELVR